MEVSSLLCQFVNVGSELSGSPLLLSFFLAAGFVVTFGAGLAGSFLEAEFESSQDDSSFLTGALS